MRTTLCVLLVSALLGIMWACGGATEQPVKAPEDVSTQAEEPADAGPAAEVPPVEETAAEEPSDAGPAAEKPAAEEPPAEEPPAESDFVGKGSKVAVIGTNKGAKGPVNFPHWAHQERGTKCFVCHHKGSGRKKCSRCHKAKEVEAPAIRNTMHKKCKSCHKKNGVGISCETCHQPKS